MISGKRKPNEKLTRAYGGSVEKAAAKGRQAIVEAMNKASAKIPQDRMFYLDCKIEAFSKIKYAVMDAEKGVPCGV